MPPAIERTMVRVVGAIRLRKRVGNHRAVLAAMTLAAGIALSESTIAAPVPAALVADAVGLPLDFRPHYPEPTNTAWETLMEASPASIEEWLQSGDGPSISIAIHILDRRGHVQRLGELNGLLESPLQGLPYVMQGAEGGLPRATPSALTQTVAQQLAVVYLRWFEVDVRSYPGWPAMSFNDAFGGVSDFNALGYPKLLRLAHARGKNDCAVEMGEPTPVDVAPLVADILALPEETRWPILLEARSRGLFTEQEVKTHLAALSDTFKQRLLNNEPIPCPEPAFRATPSNPDPSRLKSHRIEARRLLASP